MFCGRKCFCILSIIFIFLNVYLINGVITSSDDIPFPETSSESYISSIDESLPTEEPPSSAALESKPFVNKDTAYSDDSYKEKLSVYKNIILPYNEHKTPDYLGETLFIGDSNTVGLSAYGYMPLQNVLGKKSMGIQGFLSDNYVWFKGFSNPVTAVEAAGLLCPRRIIINFGTNNAAGTSVSDFISLYKTALHNLEQLCPYSDIIVAAVLPVGYYRENYSIKQSTVDSFNLALARMCSEMGYKFLDYSEVFKDSKSGYMNPNYVADDGIHLNSNGYSILLEYVENHQFITEDTRPEVFYTPVRCESRQLATPEGEAVEADADRTDNADINSDTTSNNLSDSSSDSNDTQQEKIIYDPFI